MKPNLSLASLTAALLLALVTAAGLASAAQEAETPPYKRKDVPAAQRADDLLGRMTLEEKVNMLGGAGFSTKPLPRLGIPPLGMADGPVGVRSGKATAFPVSVAMAATWDPELIQEVGRALGREARAKGLRVLLGPCVNIHRVPQGGRNFESFGEDPYLASRMTVAYVKGVQSQQVLATLKHYACNNQETNRGSVDVRVDERTLQEIYLPAFRAGVQEAGAWCVMAAYNKVNGAHCAENAHLLKDILKDQWGFKGFVMSDWGAVHSLEATANSGLDLEMPNGRFLNKKLLDAVQQGSVKPAVIDDKIRRMLRAMFSCGLFDEAPQPDPAVVNCKAHQDLARRVAAAGLVLLKNAGGLLPLDVNKVKSIAILGPNAEAARTGGGGSSAVSPVYSVSPVEGLTKRAGDRIRLTIFTDAKAPVERAAEAARGADVAVVFAGLSGRQEREGGDRGDLLLLPGQDALIAAVAAANRNTVVVLNSGTPLTLGHWLEQTPAVIEAWFAGQECGNAIADVLFGDANPSGKLPVTFLKDGKDSPAYGNFPGQNGTVNYAEGVFVGYRHFDRARLEPLFPFGHGLSYTTFAYRDLTVTPRRIKDGQPVEVAFELENTGAREGAEAAQVYVRDVKASVERPPQELKAFQKVRLKPGEKRRVTVTLDRSALAFYDPVQKTWVAEPGEFEVLVGSSSRDIRARGRFELE